jgi:hypothetical protein
VPIRSILDLNAAIVVVNNLLHNSQTQPCSRCAGLIRSLAAEKSLE